MIVCVTAIGAGAQVEVGAGSKLTPAAGVELGGAPHVTTIG